MEKIHRTLELAHPPRIELATLESERRRARQAEVDHATLRARRLVLPGDGGSAATAYRMLRTQLLQRIRAHGARVLGIVSAVDGEGKTLTAVNLALALSAEPNQTVLLADLDLRRPSLAKLLGLDAPRGLEEWFAGRAEIDDLFCRIAGIQRLSILPTLCTCAGSSELLADERVKELLHELRTRYDDRLILLDLPPALLTDDMLTMVPMLDGVILVASEGYTRRDDLDRMRELLGTVRLIGTVLNQASESERRAY